MSGWSPVAAGTLFMPSGPKGNHLFVILNNPTALDGYPGKMCALVCICSVPEDIPYDQTCTLDVGQHPFVKHPSYISYKHARIEEENFLIQLVTNGVFIPDHPVNDPPFSAIKHGLVASLFTKRAFKNLPI